MKEGTRHLLEKAERAIQAADVLLTTIGAEFAAGRAYYAMFYTAEALLHDRLGIADDPVDQFLARGNVVDQAGILPHRQRRLLCVADFARRADLREGLGLLLAQRPFPPCPALDEAIAPRARHGAGPDLAGRDVGNLRQGRVMTIAVHDRLLEILMQRRFLACQEPRTEQHAVGAERKRSDQAASVSKPVAAMGALVLVEDGKLSLDGDVNKFLKSWKVPANEYTAKAPVTLEGLLSHTAGLTVHGFPGYGAGATVPAVNQILDGAAPANTAAVRVTLAPGSQFRYSGGGYTIAQLAMTDVTVWGNGRNGVSIDGRPLAEGPTAGGTPPGQKYASASGELRARLLQLASE